VTEVAAGPAIHLDHASGVGDSDVPAAAPVQIRAVLQGAGIGFALTAIAALAALLFTAAVFGYPSWGLA
jgi:hypothetical protein